MAEKRSTAVVDDTPVYAGRRFGLPERGAGSVAPMSRRLAALVIDWVACYLIVAMITGHQAFSGVHSSSDIATQLWATLALFGEIWLPTAVAGVTFGKKITGIRVIRTDGSLPGLGWALLRTVLLFCVVPPCLADHDLRGLHDRAADTIVVRA